MQEVISKSLFSCAPGDDVRGALETMRVQKVRRLPVVDQAGRLMGIVSLHDIALHAGSNKGADVPAETVLDTFISITTPRIPAPA